MTHNVTGGCLCGTVRFTAALTARTLRVCACTQCLRQNGGPWFDLPDVAQVRFDGPVAVYVSSPGHRRGFCAACGSTLFWQRGDQPPALSHGALDDGAGFALRDFEHQDTCPDAYRVVATTEDLQ